MNKIEKFLRRLNKKERQIFILLLKKLKEGSFNIPGVRKIRGKRNFYRIRIGKYRLIFCVKKNGDIEFRRITKKDEQTYKNI